LLTAVRPEEVQRTPLSPELVLVTPEIAEYARSCLPEEPWAAFVHPPRTVAARASKLTTRGRTKRTLGKIAIGGVALVGGLAIAYLPSDWGAAARPGRQAQPQRPRAISWPAVAGAAYYDVRLVRDGVRILDLGPRTAHAVLPLRWTYGGLHYQLGPGTYRWYVFAGRGDPLELRLGALHRQGELSVGAAAPSR
jgi:hypothetical protein